MAKATATCTCATCGAMFTRTKICRNRREADGWEVWAAANFDECDACYTARKASEREAAAAAETELPLTLHMTGYPYKDSTPVVLFFGGDTMPHKDDIKALGYRWVFADDYITYGYSVQRGEQKWIKVVPQEDAYDEIKRAKALGAVIDDSIVDTEYLAKKPPPSASASRPLRHPASRSRSNRYATRPAAGTARSTARRLMATVSMLITLRCRSAAMTPTRSKNTPMLLRPGAKQQQQRRHHHD